MVPFWGPQCITNTEGNKVRGKYERRGIMKKSKLDPKDRDPATMKDLEDAMKQLAESPSKTKSENREPTRKELEQRFKLVRRK